MQSSLCLLLLPGLLAPPAVCARTCSCSHRLIPLSLLSPAFLVAIRLSLRACCCFRLPLGRTNTMNVQSSANLPPDREKPSKNEYVSVLRRTQISARMAGAQLSRTSMERPGENNPMVYRAIIFTRRPVHSVKKSQVILSFSQETDNIVWKNPSTTQHRELLQQIQSWSPQTQSLQPVHHVTSRPSSPDETVVSVISRPPKV